MATENAFANLGLDFTNWQRVPSLSEAIMKIASGQGGPIVKTIGMLMSGDGSEGGSSGGQSNPMGLGQGIAPPATPGGQGINMQQPSGVGIAPSQFQMSGLTLPKLGTAPTTSSSQTGPGIDVDGDGQIDNFWGIKK